MDEQMILITKKIKNGTMELSDTPRVINDSFIAAENTYFGYSNIIAGYNFVVGVKFKDCIFKNCKIIGREFNLGELIFENCKFINCTFLGTLRHIDTKFCSLNNVSFHNYTGVQVRITDSYMIKDVSTNDLTFIGSFRIESHYRYSEIANINLSKGTVDRVEVTDYFNDKRLNSDNIITSDKSKVSFLMNTKHHIVTGANDDEEKN